MNNFKEFLNAIKDEAEFKAVYAVLLRWNDVTEGRDQMYIAELLLEIITILDGENNRIELTT